jgi:outer membrane protein TolC
MPLTPLVLACLLGWGLQAQGQTVPRPAAENTQSQQQQLQAQRDQTLARVQAVTADRPGSLDTTNALATQRSLKPSAKPDVAVTPGGLVGPRDANGKWIDPGILLPPLSVRKPDTARMVRREAPLLSSAQSGPVFSPDFSRQRLSLAQMSGLKVVDLPQLSEADPEPIATVDVPPEKALKLADLVRLGLEQSPVLEQARALLNIATSSLDRNRSDFFPSAALRVASGDELSQENDVSTPKHNYKTRTVRLTQPIFDLPIYNNHASAKATEEAARLRLLAARETVALSVTQAVLNLASSRLTLNDADELIRQTNGILTYLEIRAQVGAASQADLERARSRVLSARQTRLEQQATYRSALLELQRLTGVQPEGLSLPFLNELPGLPKTLAELNTLVIDHSAELKALRSEIAAQESTVRAETSRLLPTANISLEHDRKQNVGGISAPAEDNRVLLVMNWGLNLGGKEIFARNQAKAELTNRNAKLDEETRRAKQALESDFALLQSTSLRLNAAQAERDASLIVVNAVQQQLQVGRLGSLLDALDSSERLFSARNRLNQALTQQMQAQAQLLRRLGTLSQVESAANVVAQATPSATDKAEAVAPDTTTK